MMYAILLSLLAANTEKLNLPNGLLSALCYVESKHDIRAVNPDDGKTSSLGACQIKLATAKGLGFKGTERDLMNPKENVYYAAKYLKKQLTRYHGDARKAVAAYNAGTYKQCANGLAVNQVYVKLVFKAWGEGR